MPLILVTPYRSKPVSVPVSPPDTFEPSSISLSLSAVRPVFKKQAQFVDGQSNVLIDVLPTQFKKAAQFIEGVANVQIAAMRRR